MYQLKQQGKIDHLVASFFVMMNNGNSSSIKFGSADVSGQKQYSQMTNLKTNDIYSWHLKSNVVRIGGVEVSRASQFIDLDPQLPYIYVPDNVWIDISEEFARIYND